MDDRKKIVVIGGPTCSGKTEISTKLAENLPFEIVNFDSLCFYKYFDIGSAKPEKPLFLKTRHHLFDIKMPDEDYNAFDYSKDASFIIDDILSRGKFPLLVGGTGLYAKAVIYGLAQIPKTDKGDIRKALFNSIETTGLKGLYEKLKTVDPLYASNISGNDRVRIIRALEVYNSTGVPFSSYLNSHLFRNPKYNFINIILVPQKDILKQKIKERTLSILKKGLVEETSNIIKMGYFADLKPFKGVGYKEAVMYITGEIKTEEELYEKVVKATIQYSKRQLTWFKRSARAVFVDPADADNRQDISSIAEYLYGFLWEKKEYF